MSVSDAEWREVIEEQVNSEQSQREFCKARGIPIGTFKYQKCRLKEKEVSSEEFVEIGSRADQMLELVVSERVTLRLPLNSSLERIKELTECFR